MRKRAFPDRRASTFRPSFASRPGGRGAGFRQCSSQPAVIYLLRQFIFCIPEAVPTRCDLSPPSYIRSPCRWLLKATGACPLEDIGGAWGYEEFLEALADPDLEQREDMVH